MTAEDITLGGRFSPLPSASRAGADGEVEHKFKSVDPLALLARSTSHFVCGHNVGGSTDMKGTVMTSTRPGTTITPEDIRDLPTLCTGQCCSLKIEKPGLRVWLCRVAGGVSIEFYIPHTGRWDIVAGDCGATDGATIPETVSADD